MTFEENKEEDNNAGLYESLLRKVEEEDCSYKFKDTKTEICCDEIIDKILQHTDDRTMIYTRESIVQMCNSYTREKTKERKLEYTTNRQMRLFVGTWNVAGNTFQNSKKEEPSLSSLDDWICSDWGRQGERSADMVVIGLQEIVDLNVTNILALKGGSSSRIQEAYWIDRITTTINNPKYNSTNRYTCILSKCLVGLFHCIFLKETHLPYINHIHSDKIKLGMKGLVGNKGGISIRFQWYDTTLCFVCAHLAAGRENVLARNTGFWSILQHTSFPVIDSVGVGKNNVGCSIQDHDYIFWTGDLNYRLSEDISLHTIQQMLQTQYDDHNNKDNHNEQLQQYDQLQMLKNKKSSNNENKVFENFKEGFINFKPTYKYIIGTNEYDMENEPPAWCDRILWKETHYDNDSTTSLPTTPTQVNDNVQQLSYTSCNIPTISDHKPVMSTFYINIQNIIPTKYKEVQDHIITTLVQDKLRTSLDIDNLLTEMEYSNKKGSSTAIVTTTLSSIWMEMCLVFVFILFFILWNLLFVDD